MLLSVNKVETVLEDGYQKTKIVFKSEGLPLDRANNFLESITKADFLRRIKLMSFSLVVPADLHLSRMEYESIVLNKPCIKRITVKCKENICVISVEIVKSPCENDEQIRGCLKSTLLDSKFIEGEDE